MGITYGEKGLGEIGGLDVEVIKVVADLSLSDGQSIWWMKDGNWRMEVLLEVGGFDVYGSVEMTVIQVHIDIQ